MKRVQEYSKVSINLIAMELDRGEKDTRIQLGLVKRNLSYVVSTVQ